MISRYEQLLKAVELERKHEQAYFQKLSLSKTNAEKIDAGILWTPLQLVRKSYTIGEYIEVELERTKHLDKNHKFKVGIGANLFVELGERTNLRGTISFVRKNKIRIILNTEFLSKDDILEKGRLGIEMIYDERPYQVMKETLKSLMASEEPNHVAIRKAIETRSAEGITVSPVRTETLNLHGFNPPQQLAIVGALRTDHLAVIHGPPGTGKTTTLIGLIQNILKTEKRVLVCAPSNNAVDLLSRMLDAKGLDVLRVGNVTRIGDSIANLTLDEKARNHPEWQHIKKVKIEAANARTIAGKYKRAFSDRARRNRSNMYSEAKELKKWARDLESKLMTDLLQNAQVITTTLIGAHNKVLKGIEFKTAIIDEASQTLEPECWVAILKSQRIIFAGDTKQLPPTVKSSEAIEHGLAETILDRMASCEGHSFLLKEQYRMNKQILAFPNLKFYDGLLYGNDNVVDRILEGDPHPIEFIDTSGCGFEEEVHADSLSKFNKGEFFILREHFARRSDLYKDSSIGIISPYAAQVRYLRQMKIETAEFAKLDIAIDTIDGFQGQEKDVIYISFVRSNDISEIGFLKDYRRLNVALTRAKMKLVMIGDGATLGTDNIYLDLIEHVEKHGHYHSAWEYMS